jgi:predicted enzyme related to lactoylglutathione lyase
MWQPAEFPGFGRVREHGTPGWFELHTRDFAASLDFYRDIFGWTTETVGDTDEFRYAVLKHGDEQLAGVMDASSFLPAGVPAHWSVYFAVDDTNAALRDIERLGGATVMPAEDTPYGRLAVATDPTGATFKLVGPNDAMPANG